MSAHQKIIDHIESWLKRRQLIEDLWMERLDKTGSTGVTLEEDEEHSGDSGMRSMGWQPFILVFTKKNFKEIRCVNTFEHHFDAYDYKIPDRYIYWFGWAETAEEIRERIVMYHREGAESMHEYYRRFYEFVPLWMLSNGDHILCDEGVIH